MSLIVINPFSRYSSSTRRSFSTLFFVRIRSASSRLVSAGAVTRLSLVITSSIRSSLDSRNRRSRRVGGPPRPPPPGGPAPPPARRPPHPPPPPPAPPPRA